MKITEFILVSICASLCLAVSQVHAQVLSEGQPAVLKDEQAPANYVYDLKALIKKSRENIKNVDLKIKQQAVIKRNQKREDKAREYYLQAMKLQEEGRLEEARQLFEKAIRITEHPEMMGYIKESSSRARTQDSALRKEEDDQERRLNDEERLALQKAEDEYQVAVNLYRQQHFKEARTAFEVVEETSPDYKATRSYLQIIEQDIARQDNKDIKGQKQEIERQQKEAEVARLREKELWRKEIEQKEEERTAQLKKQADAAYNEALKLYQDKKYQEAKAKFQEVDWVMPDFKATRAYLERVDLDIDNDKKRLLTEREKEQEKQRWEETLAQRKAAVEKEKALQVKERERQEQLRDQAEFIYGAAVTLFDKSNHVQAKEKFDEVESIYPNYKLTRNYLRKLERLLGLPASEFKDEESSTTVSGKSQEAQDKILAEEAQRKKEERERFKQLSVETEDAFNDALNLYRTGHLLEAKEKFLAVDQKIPDYKSTRSYLKSIDDDIALLASTHKLEQAFMDQKAEVDKLKELKEKAEASYAAARALFDAKDFVKAQAAFQEVAIIIPDFKQTNSYLHRIDEELARKKEETRRHEVESQANLLYAQAVVSYNTGQFEEAKKKFIEAEDLLPNYKDINKYLEHIDDDILAKKEQDLLHLKELQVKDTYAEALRLYQNKEYKAAKGKFLEVVAVYPNYKDTASFLNKIDDDIEKQRVETVLREKTTEAETVYKQAMGLFQAGDFVAAKDKFVRLEVIWPDYKDTPRYLHRIDSDIALKQQKDELARRSDEAAPVYEQALALYKHREFVEANKKFMQVQVLSPGFRDTAVYLSRLERDIKIQQEQTARLEQLRKADELYTQALKLYAEHKFTEAKTKLLETAAVDSNYKDLHSYLGHIDKDIGSEAGLKERQSVEQRAEGPYSQAVTLYHERKFALAKEKFIETAKIMPDYKKVRSYIARIDQDISDETSKSQRTRIEKAAVLYRDAQSLLSGHQFKEAFVKLAELEVVCPDYKDTRKRTEEVKALLVLNGIPVPEVTAAPVNTETPSSDGLSEEQIFALYKEAVSRYKAQDYPEARKLFEKISKARLQYRSTAKYLQSIDAIVGTQEKPNAAEQPAVRVKQGTPDAAAGEAKKAQVVQAEKLYREAVEFFKAGKYTEAKVKFEEAEALAPGYKSARHYIALSTKAQEKLAQPAAVRSQEKPASAAVSKAQSGQNSDMLRALAKRSEEIYNQIKKLAQDKDMASTQQTFEQVDRIISRLEKDQQRMAAEVEARQRREQEEGIRQKQVEKTTEIRNARKAQAETKQLLEAEKQKMTEAEHVRLGDLKDKEKEKARQEQKAFDDKVEALYQKALEAARNKQYAVAREAFTEITSVRPNYKDSIKVLTRIDREEGEARLVEYENKDRETVTALVERATVINMESVRLIEAGNYDEVHKKFDELGGILREVQNIKKTMLTRRREFSERWEKRMAQTRASGVASQRSPDKVVADVDSGINSAKARAVFQEGEKLYAAQNYSEAKAKFVEASCIDPKLQAAVTYITRINRIQEKQDFESQKERNKMQARILERKEESPKEAAAVDASASVSAAADRTKHLLDSGLELYRTRRYREARIKFEELQQIGDARQCKQAKHYLASIETILQKEKAEAEKERQAEHERYLRERRAQDIGTGQKPKTPVATGVTPSLTRAERDQEIQRQQELRAIEQQNAIERKQALSGSMAQEGQTAMSTNVEQSQKVQSVVTDVQPVLNGEKSITCTKFEENAVTVPVKGTKICKISFKSQGEKTHASAAPCRPRALRTVKDNDALEMNAYKARIQKEKVRLEKQEAVQRKADEKKREHLMQDTNVLDKVRVEEGRKKKAQIAAIESPSGSKPTAVAVPLQSGAAVKPLSASDTQEASLRLSIENGKRALQQQREAIRRDFEDGVERLYTDAVDLFKKRLYEEARQEFLQVADMIQGYKKTDYYLGQISRVLKVDSQNLASQAPNPIPHSSQTSSQVLAEAKRIQAISRELDAVEQQVHR